jgi:hypothetical protein
MFRITIEDQVHGGVADRQPHLIAIVGQGETAPPD